MTPASTQMLTGHLGGTGGSTVAFLEPSMCAIPESLQFSSGNCLPPESGRTGCLCARPKRPKTQARRSTTLRPGQHACQPTFAEQSSCTKNGFPGLTAALWEAGRRGREWKVMSLSRRGESLLFFLRTVLYCGKGERKGKEWRNYGKRTAASVCTSRPVTRRCREKTWERSQRLRDARLTSMRPRR